MPCSAKDRAPSTLIEAGKVRSHIDRRYPFGELPAAIAYLEHGRTGGKVVVGGREGLLWPA